MATLTNCMTTAMNKKSFFDGFCKRIEVMPLYPIKYQDILLANKTRDLLDVWQ